MLTDPHFLGLIDAIREEPADDWLRLVLADWLEARDEVEANVWSKFIRDQIAWENLEQKECSGRVFCEGSDWTRGAKRRCPACELAAGMHQTVYLWNARSRRLCPEGRMHWGDRAPGHEPHPTQATTWWRRGLIAEVEAPAVPGTLATLRMLQGIHPVEKVVAADRRPQHTSLMSVDASDLYFWWDTSSLGVFRNSGCDELPTDVFDSLEGYLDSSADRRAGAARARAYKTEDDANAALSRALLKLARGGANGGTK